MDLLRHWLSIFHNLKTPYIADKFGRKFWKGWDEGEVSSTLLITYKGDFVGEVKIITDKNHIDRCILDELFVTEEYRNIGLGKGLLEEAKRKAKNHAKKYLWSPVEPHNGTTIIYLLEWYKRQGFLIEQIDNKFYAICQLF